MQFNASLPLLVMFGIDYTIWPFRAHFTVPPYTKISDKRLVDKEGYNITCYPEVPMVFERLQKQGIRIALGTMSININATQDILNLLDLDKYISFKEFERGFYDGMFESIQRQSHIRYEDMLFFDDYDYNIETMEKEGVLGVIVPKEGMTMNLLDTGLKLYMEKKSKEQNRGK